MYTFDEKLFEAVIGRPSIRNRLKNSGLHDFVLRECNLSPIDAPRQLLSIPEADEDFVSWLVAQTMDRQEVPDDILLLVTKKFKNGQTQDWTKTSQCLALALSKTANDEVISHLYRSAPHLLMTNPHVSEEIKWDLHSKHPKHSLDLFQFDRVWAPLISEEELWSIYPSLKEARPLDGLLEVVIRTALPLHPQTVRCYWRDRQGSTTAIVMVNHASSLSEAKGLEDAAFHDTPADIVKMLPSVQHFVDSYPEFFSFSQLTRDIIIELVCAKIRRGHPICESAIISNNFMTKQEIDQLKKNYEASKELA